MGFKNLALQYLQQEATVTANATTEDVTVIGLRAGDNVVITPRENAIDQITVDNVAEDTLTVACEGDESGGTDITILVFKKQKIAGG